MRENRFQISVATGRITLPVVSLICLLLWGATSEDWNDAVSMAVMGLTGYLMLEANASFTLIRTRTTLPTCIYCFLFTAFYFLHAFQWSYLAPLAFLLSVFQLFHSYESPDASSRIFHIFFFLSAGTLVFPPLVYFAPVFLIGMLNFRSMTFKSLFAGILGFSLPYWLLFGYALWYDRMPLLFEALQKMTHFQPIRYGEVPMYELVSAGVVTVSLFLGGFHYLHVSYLDKTRTRGYLDFLVLVGLWTTLFMFLQPCHLRVLIQIQLLCASFMTAHLFTLTRNRFSGVCFVVTLIVFILLTVYNLWTQFFNF